MNTYTLLLVDDEQNILNSLTRLLRREKYSLLTANGGLGALEILKENKVDLIISDQRMPGMTGVELLKQVKKLYPDIVRLVLSGYADFDSILAAINEGEIYRFISKPWNDEELKLTIKRSLEQYQLVLENRVLEEKIKKQNEELILLNKSLEDKVQERTQQLVIRNQALQIFQEVLEHLPLAVFGVSSEGDVVLANKKAHQIFASAHTSLIDADVNEIFPQEVVKTLNQTIENGSENFCEQIWGENQNLSIHCVPLKRQDHESGVILIVDELTKEKKEHVPA